MAFSREYYKKHGYGPKTQQTAEEAWRSEFARDTALQAEFGSNPERYIAFKKAEMAGRVKIFKKQNVSR